MTQESEPRLFHREGFVYRVIEPEWWAVDPFGLSRSNVKVDAFEDRHVANAETLSFFVEGYTPPTAALSAIAKRRSVRDACGTGKIVPTPRQMYAAGYRVARIPAQLILRCEFGKQRTRD
jgi:hypothetical protein